LNALSSEDHLFSDPGSELLKRFAPAQMKVLPGQHGPKELHEGDSPNKFTPARCQVKGQRTSPIVRDHKGRLDSSVGEECIEVPDMIGKPVLDPWFS
jgi:hypothetical protein